MVFAVAFCGLASMFPNRAVAFVFFALCFSESVPNGLFHVGATVTSWFGVKLQSHRYTT